MASELLNVTFGCADAESISSFWSSAVGRPATFVDMPGNPFWVVPSASDAGTRLVFVTVEETTPDRNRVHLDLVPGQETSQAAELARLQSLGATVVDDRRELEPGGWIVMADTAGTEFCLEAGAG